MIHLLPVVFFIWNLTVILDFSTKKLINIKEPVDVKYKEFGLVGAVYNVAEEIGMVEILRKNINETRYGIDNWIYFFV